MANKNELITSNDIRTFPNTLQGTLPHINQLIDLFNVPRDIIADEECIENTWNNLPRYIRKIPRELRNELIVKMCISASVGLFDGAINYMWNATIINLRSKVINFGLSTVNEITGKQISERSLLNNTNDAELLELCYQLELLSQDGFFLLNQCRDIRNNFSAAHPTLGKIDDAELINFINRCCKYGFTEDYTCQNINTADFIKNIKNNKLDDTAITQWVERLKSTFPAQRQMLYPTLLGIYCDSDVGEVARINALKICEKSLDFLDKKVKSNLIEKYNNYFVKNKKDKLIASKTFFTKLGLLNLLSSSEQHSIIKNACDDLLNVHNGFDNFYNEPPFAKRLLELSSQIKIPATAQSDYVHAVVTPFIGNGYGVSNSAIPYYQEMIENFSPNEINYLLNIVNEDSLVSYRIKNFPICMKRYVDTLNLISEDSLNTKQKALYDTLLNKFRKIS